MTGLSKPTILRALKTLENDNTIAKIYGTIACVGDLPQG